MALENFSYPEDVRVRAEAQELVAAEFAVTVLAPRARGQRRKELIDGVIVKRYRLPTLAGAAGIVVEYMVAFLQLTPRVLLEISLGAEVVHLHNPPDIFFPIAKLARMAGKIVIFDHHDLAPELYEQKFGSGWPVAVLRWCERMTMCIAHVVIAANESHRLVAIDRGGVRPDRAIVVRNGPRRATIAAQPHARDGYLSDPRLCYVGTLGSQDGVSVLPAVLSRLAQIGMDPTLMIVGDGPELPSIEQAAEDCGVRARITFVGRVAHEDVPALIGEADICLDVAPCSPLNHQSTMIKIGEYLAAGRPVVTFDLEETRFSAGDCALYAPCGDVNTYCDLVAQLCTSSSMRLAFSQAALIRAQALTWERSAEHLRYAYAAVTNALVGS
jgi:glycosyltransferase involved in cell wall biosynthesis